MQRIIWIDIAKAICIILVAIGHYIPDTHPAWYGEMRSVIYTFHMPLFMIVSGYIYIVTKRNIAYGSFIWKKVRRLLIPYFTVSILIVTIKLCTQGQAYVENPVTLSSYLKLFYLPEAGYFLWFIWALWWMFVIIPLFKTTKSRLCLLFAAFLLSIFSSYMPKTFCIEEFSKMLPFFVTGVVLYDWKYCFIWFVRVPILIVWFYRI